LAVKIRLRRVGAKKQPSYRVVIADSRAPRDGRFIEIIGFYNPRTKPTTITIDEEKARKWLSQGAMPTESVASLLYRAGIVDMRAPRWRNTLSATAEAEPIASTDAATQAAPTEQSGSTEPSGEPGPADATTVERPEDTASVAPASETAPSATAAQPENTGTVDAATDTTES